MAPSRAEKANINYELHQTIDDPTVFVFYENWSSMDAFIRHKESPHFRNFLTQRRTYSMETQSDANEQDQCADREMSRQVNGVICRRPLGGGVLRR